MKRIKGSKLEDGHHHEDHHNLFSRKDFIKRLGLYSAGSALSLGSTPVQALQSSSLFKKLAGIETNRVLVLIQLDGGNDGLNTIIPYENDLYYNYRNDIAIPKQEAISLSETMGMHPEMNSLIPLWEDGKMGIIQSVGYENGSLSHFRSTDIWLSGSDSDEVIDSGWLGRHLDIQNPNFIAEPPTSPLAVQIGGASSLLFRGDEFDMGMTLSDVERLEYLIENGELHSLQGIPETLYGDEMKFMRIQANNSFRYAEAIQESFNESQNRVEYNESALARSLSVVSRLIKGNLGTKIYLVTLSGFDTHADQLDLHANLINTLSSAVSDFYNDLAADNRSEEVLIATFSEFGRRVYSNGAEGTDHGTAAPLFIFGDSVNGGLIGSDPLLEPENLDPYNNLIAEYDFRQVYTTLLTDWFGLDESEASITLGDEFEKIPFLNSGATVSTGNREQPIAFQLNQNYPNPFNPTTTISFYLNQSAPVRLQIFDIHGRFIQTLIERKISAGEHSIQYNAGSLSSGTYIYRLQIGGTIKTKKMTLIK